MYPICNLYSGFVVPIPTSVNVDNPADVQTALEDAFAQKDQMVFMDFITDQSENVYPMIAGGAGHNEMHLKPSSDGKVPQIREVA